MRDPSYILATVLLLAACGRIGFDPTGIATDGEDGINDLSIGELVIDEITEDSYRVTIGFLGDENATGTVGLHVCNRTDHPTCDPGDSEGLVMSRSGSVFELERIGLLSPNDPGDELAVELIAQDSDGVSGSPAVSTLTLDFLGCLVDSALDVEDIAINGACEAGSGCTLRAALAEAKAGNCGSEILIKANQTIVVDPVLGAFDVSFDVKIRGQNRETVILDGANQSQVMRVAGKAIIKSLTIANGNGSPIGGGLEIVDATVDLVSVNFLNNTVTNAGGTSYGGGLGVTGLSVVSIDGSRFIGNTASDKGGGGIGFRDGGTLEIIGSLFENNSAPTGAGIYTQSAGMNISNSLFVNNDAGGFVGAVDIGCSATGNFRFANSTFVDNDAGSSGAIFACPSVTMEVLYSTFVDNAPSDLHHFASGTTTTLTANVFGSFSGTDVDFCSGFPGFISTGFNVWQAADGDCGVLAIGSDVVSDSPALLPLGDNGGRIPTIGLGIESPAIDLAVGNPMCPPDDQRGYRRPVGLACDSGAFEVGAVSPAQ